jgi:hypothetical protein
MTNVSSTSPPVQNNGSTAITVPTQKAYLADVKRRARTEAENTPISDLKLTVAQLSNMKDGELLGTLTSSKETDITKREEKTRAYNLATKKRVNDNLYVFRQNKTKAEAAKKVAEAKKAAKAKKDAETKAIQRATEAKAAKKAAEKAAQLKILQKKQAELQRQIQQLQPPAPAPAPAPAPKNKGWLSF